MSRLTLPILLAYVATIYAANLAIAYLPPVPVLPGLYAPAGVFFAGLAFSLRDWLQEAAGRRAVLLAILLGALLSASLSGPLALASGAAFLLGELADLAIYTPLRERSRPLAVLLSNTVGDAVDSALFLWLAFGSLGFLAGQMVGKIEMTLLTLALMALWRRVARPTRVEAL